MNWPMKHVDPSKMIVMHYIVICGVHVRESTNNSIIIVHVISRLFGSVASTREIKRGEPQTARAVGESCCNTIGGINHSAIARPKSAGHMTKTRLYLEWLLARRLPLLAAAFDFGATFGKLVVGVD